MLSIFRTRRAKAITGAITGVGIVGGSAVAAILLTTSITGTLDVNTVDTANELKVTASAASGSQLDCSRITLSPDFKTLALNPKLTKPAGGSNASVPVVGGECTYTVEVKNIGQTTLKVDPSSGLSEPPLGWTLTDLAGTALNPIAPGATGVLTAKLSASEAAQPGTLTGKLVYTDAT